MSWAPDRRVRYILSCEAINNRLLGQRLCVSSGTLPPPTHPNGDGSCQAVCPCVQWLLRSLRCLSPQYMVVSGDTCSAIATKFSITAAQIEQWNAAAGTYKWTSCSALQVGYVGLPSTILLMLTISSEHLRFLWNSSARSVSHASSSLTSTADYYLLTV